MTRKPERETPHADVPLNQREAAKLATQRAVLAAARDSFEELGFERANLREIAARAQVSAGTVLHYYGDKRALLHAAQHFRLDVQRGNMTSCSKSLGCWNGQPPRTAPCVQDVHNWLQVQARQDAFGAGNGAHVRIFQEHG